MIYGAPPADFDPVFEIVSCYLEHDDRFLLLHRRSDKSQGGKWGAVAGKVDDGESLEKSMAREIYEETGITTDLANLQSSGVQYVRWPDIDFVYHVFRYELSSCPKITLSPTEHIDYRWVTPKEALAIPLVDDMDSVIRLTHLS
jgi:8-oxo-dGTP pyrophosphatase MutT (NUDIX family)